MTEERLKKCYKLFDTDNSGFIEIYELKDMFNHAGIDDAVWMEMLKEVDENSDGLISYKEFVEIMLTKN